MEDTAMTPAHGDDRPTPHERELLTKIVNPKQRAALLAAIARGEEIPDFAWHPLPADLDLDEVVADPGFQDAAHRLGVRTPGSSPRSAERITELIDAIDETEYDDHGLLKRPGSAHDVLGGVAPSATLVQWFYFNPMGPTLDELNLYLDQLRRRWILAMAHFHPMDRDVIVYGVLSDEVVRGKQRLLCVLRELYDRNGAEDYPLLSDLPTSVIVSESDLGDEDARALFERSAHSLDLGDLATTCRLLKECRGNPMKRVSKEMDLAIERIRRSRDGSAQIPRGDQMAHFPLWWSLVTDRVHVESEVISLSNPGGRSMGR